MEKFFPSGIEDSGKSWKFHRPLVNTRETQNDGYLLDRSYTMSIGNMALMEMKDTSSSLVVGKGLEPGKGLRPLENGKR